MADNSPIIIPAEQYPTFPQSPRLTPNTGQAFAGVVDGTTNATRNGFGQNALASQAAFLKAYPRVAATATLTISGSIATSDVITASITNPVMNGGKVVTVSYTVQASDTAKELAAGLASAVNASTELQAFGINATWNEAVMTLNHPGPVGNQTTFTAAASPGSEVLTISRSPLAGGTGAIIPFEGFTTNFAGMNYHFNAGEPRELSGPFVTALVKSGLPIV